MSYSTMNAMVDIVAAPGAALEWARERPKTAWWPLLVVVTAAAGVLAFYYSWVDFDWMVEEMIRASFPPGADPAQADAMRDMMTPGMQITMSVIGIAVMTLVIYLLQSTYLHLVNKVAGDPALRFGQWFSLSAWTGFVGIFNVIAMLIVILIADSPQLGPDQLAPLSLNALFVHAEMGTPWFTWANSLTLVHLWILGLLAYGFARWTRSSLGKSAVIVTIPWALLFGVWALLI